MVLERRSSARVDTGIEARDARTLVTRIRDQWYLLDLCTPVPGNYSTIIYNVDAELEPLNISDSLGILYSIHLAIKLLHLGKPIVSVHYVSVHGAKPCK